MDALFVERFPEPFTGLPLVGVGGERADDAVVEVFYDGAMAARLMPKRTDRGYHFATQLPVEAGVKIVRVAINATTVFESPIEMIPWRHAAAMAAAPGFLRRSARSILSGEVFSPARWFARVDRFREKLLHLQQRVRTKLLRRKLRARSSHESYIERHPPMPARNHRHQPVISILMPVYQVEPKWFRAAVESVRSQTYPHWQLCIADDASTRVDLLAEFDRLPADDRIRFVRRSANGHICAASNSAADLATGEFVALLDHDDALAPDALDCIVEAINANHHVDLVYSDEDKIDAKGRRYDPQHKPGWSPELLLSYNYINHFTVMRRSLFERVGRFRPGYEGSQDHDLLLRVTEQTERIIHVPRILYHWRSLPSSTASAAGVKGYVHTSGRKAVEEALQRRGVTATLGVPEFAQKLGLPVLSLAECASDARIAVIVYGDSRTASATLRAFTHSRATVYFEPQADAGSLNRLAAGREEDLLCFVQAGVMPESAAAIEQLRAYASLSGVGAVGGRINDGGGFTVTANGVRECFADQRGISYYFYREVARNVAAPCRGLLLTKRCDFESLGGFDADRYPVSLFEADYCLRLAGLGMRSVHVGDARFSLENQAGIDPCEQQTFRRAHGTIDRYSNPNFATAFEPGGDAVTVVTRPSQPLDVLVAAHNLNSPEGAPRYLSEIVLGLRSRGVLEASVVSPTGGAGAAVYHSGNIPVAILNGDWTPHLIDAQWSPRSYEACQNELRQMLKAKPPQAVLANTLLMFPWVEAAARLGIPCVWIIHESYSQQVLNRLFTPYAQARLAAAFAVATRIIPASHDTAALFRQWDVRHGIRVIHNGLDPAAIDSHCRTLSRAEACEKLGLDSTLFHAVAIGTVCERKGQHTLVEAAAMLSKTRNDFRVHLVGMRPGVPYAEYLQQLLIRRGTGDCVNLVQETNRAFDWYRAADTYVCTSHMETFSRSILEAEAFGLPIVSTPCEGIGEQVVWNQNALKFEKNDADTLACHLETLMNHRDLSRQMALKSRAVFELHNSYPQMLDEYQAVLQQACRAGSAPAVQLFRQAA